VSDGASDAERLLESIRSGDRGALARAITAVESTMDQDRRLARQLLDLCAAVANESIRVGVSGLPGAGKSTLIEKLGIHLTRKEHRVAVLAVDPSSARSGGSILGDKTRMEELARSPHAFVRPSPSRGSLGGLAPHTRETIALCEAAGYDVIFVETVGTGQSETDVAHLTDFVFLLTVSGAGDELQGIKRGVIEFADAVLVTKADGGNEEAAKATAAMLRGALGLFRSRDSGWTPRATSVSAQAGKGIAALWDLVEEYRSLTTQNGYFERKRSGQLGYWLRSSLLSEIDRRISTDPSIEATLSRMEAAVRRGEISPRSAAARILTSLITDAGNNT
jgi:LAO/AO transport system kinase